MQAMNHRRATEDRWNWAGASHPPWTSWTRVTSTPALWDVDAVRDELRSGALQVPIKEIDHAVDRAILHLVHFDAPVRQSHGEDVSVQWVVPRHPGSVVATLRQQVVAQSEDALQMVIFAPHDENGDVDRRHPLEGQRHVGARTHALGVAHLHLFDV